MTQLNINVHHVTRVEGHGNITVNTKDGKIEEITWAIPESPRFFEAMLRGLNYADVTWIAPRICGICSIAHATASIQATEAAFGVQLSEQAMLLRKLLYHAETLQSHVLHFYFLAAPDFLGVGSVFPLVNTHKEVVLRALRLKKLANDLADLIGGRKTHPMACIVGGFTKLPEISQLKVMQQRLAQAMDDLRETVKLFKGLKIPNFVRETEYIALKDPKEYAFISGDIASTDTGTAPIADYLSITNEFCVPQSTAKFSKHNRDSYMVGALARFNNNYAQLSPEAQKAAEDLGLKAICHNPYMISVAQVVESIYAVEESLKIIDQLMAQGLKEEKPDVKVKAGRGIGAVEAPRGILFHDYTYDDKGVLTEANCVIPTNQNHNNIQKDMEALVPSVINKSQEEITHLLEMLVRAYDPCISCSAHFLEVKFV
ncbi:Periplasmic [NiFeSe] hydrogenase large subunit [subsurface metagenome]|nr:Ni/Fe hydrogenase subunit alpha [Dehalococcoidia bacterium]